MELFLDVSNAQSPSLTNYKKIVAKGYKGVLVRCGEGMHSKDGAFATHVKGFLDAGMPLVGAYYVLAPSTKDPKGCAFQAMAWAQEIQVLAKDRELFFTIDIERNRPLGADAPEWRDFVLEFESHVDGNYRYYTYDSFRQQLMDVGFKPKKPWIIARYPQLLYPTAQAEALRKSCLTEMQKFNAAIKANDSKAAIAAAQARARDALALSKLELDYTPLGQPPADCEGWQVGGDANGSTVPGVLGFCDKTYYYGDLTKCKRWITLPASTAQSVAALPPPVAPVVKK